MALHVLQLGGVLADGGWEGVRHVVWDVMHLERQQGGPEEGTLSPLTAQVVFRQKPAVCTPEQNRSPGGKQL